MSKFRLSQPVLAGAIATALMAFAAPVAVHAQDSGSDRNERSTRADRSARSSDRSERRSSRQAQAETAPRYPNATREAPGISASQRLAKQLNTLSEANNEQDAAKGLPIADEILANERANEYDKSIAALLAGQLLLNDDNTRAIAYLQQARGLIEGGADILLIETIFDTLNAKAAIFACIQAMEAHGQALPLMISGTITDASGRTLSGQTPTAFWHSVRHARPWSVGLNCALGASAMRPHLAELSGVAETNICAYPNAGLPNAFGQYDEGPDDTAVQVAEFAREGLVNVVGGCCGTTPDHIRAIAEAVAQFTPRKVPEYA